MAYISVDTLQKYLQKEVFSHTSSPKKAAGRALGTIVEIITYYLLKSWGIEDSISIESKIPEFGYPEITHNVEFSLHPILEQYNIEIDLDDSSITARKLLNKIDIFKDNLRSISIHNNTLLSKDGIIRNACTIGSGENFQLVATVKEKLKKKYIVTINKQGIKPYSIFECKRVGIEEGMRRGPQPVNTYSKVSSILIEKCTTLLKFF